MPSDQDQDRGQDRRASNHSADVAPGSRQRLRRGIAERRVDLARRRDAGQLVVAVVVAVHFVARQLGLGSPARASCKRQPPSVRRGVRGVPCAWRDGVEAAGLLFLAGFARRVHKQSRGRRETRLAGASASAHPCVCSTRLRALEDSVEQYAIAATRKKQSGPVRGATRGVSPLPRAGASLRAPLRGYTSTTSARKIKR